MAPKKPAKTAETKGKVSWSVRPCVKCNSEIAKLQDSLRVLSRDYSSARFTERWTWWHRNCWGK